MRHKLVIFALFIVSLVQAQKENFSDKSISFLIHSRRVQSKEIADSIRQKEKESFNKFKKNLEKTGDTINVNTETIPSYASFDVRSVKYFRINPKEYIEFEIRDKNAPILHKNNFTNIVKITRDSLIMSFFSIDNFKVYDFTVEKGYNDFSNFKLTKKDLNDRKVIAEFDCYKVIMESDLKILEMYVSEQIDLNYHPIINDLKILKLYYPLYIKVMSKKLPQYIFSEYNFVRDNY
ncbi:hypothetical protein C7448_101197 [Tenacibaculum gallaicum]|uniref:Uncharacterized protein n=1 Tax=Tenacibaculum gallaicum TaxID=561505 RepID=A0A3E0IBQ5_9FLAO|nr:hypothetical protein [Tenacibaculum gallaicum]REH56164.1 hypothetical protein C7448_101197 [Tenacibaculum gallaicum]